MILFFPFPTRRRLPRIRAAAVLPLLLALGCASGGAAEAGSAAGSPGSQGSATASSGESGESDPSDGEAGLPGPGVLEARLAEWAEQLEEGLDQATSGAYRAVAGFRPDGGAPERTLWALAMVHLHPESPLLDRDAGTRYLAMLEEHFPDASEGVQARVFRELIGELERTTAVAEEGDRLVEELSKTVEEFRQAIEQLKRIDLNRRPVRGTRTDTIPPKAPGPPD